MIQDSIRQLCAVSIFCGAAINITPEGGVRRIMQLLCTAALTMAILSPIKEIDFDIYALETARLREAEAAINESAERIDDRLNRAVIEEQCEEYILDKAEELGANVSGVNVQAQWSLEEASIITEENPPSMQDLHSSKLSPWSRCSAMGSPVSMIAASTSFIR